MLPDGAPDSDAAIGIPIGPPDIVDVLGLPEEVATRLHNNLHRQGIWNAKVAARKPNALMTAVSATYKIDAQRLMEVLNQFDRQE
jgi:hypothetical protein